MNFDRKREREREEPNDKTKNTKSNREILIYKENSLFAAKVFDLIEGLRTFTTNTSSQLNIFRHDLNIQ